MKEPVAMHYSWATSPMENLKVNGKDWLLLHSFRTDSWDWPESEDPDEEVVVRGKNKAMNREASERLEHRELNEAKRAVEILECLETLGKGNLKAESLLFCLLRRGQGSLELSQTAGNVRIMKLKACRLAFP